MYIGSFIYDIKLDIYFNDIIIVGFYFYRFFSYFLIVWELYFLEYFDWYYSVFFEDIFDLGR